MTPEVITAWGAAAAGVLSSIASIMWPLVAGLSLLLMRTELRDLIRRVVRGKFPGGEFEAIPEVSQLAAEARQLEPTSAQLPAGQPAGSNQTDSGQEWERETVVDEVLREAARNPELGLIKLSVELEREVRNLMLASGWATGVKDVASMRNNVEELVRLGVLHSKLAGSLDLFQRVRNKLIHGRHVRAHDTLRALDAGLLLMKALQAIPRERNRVKYVRVPVFSDAECTAARSGVEAVILETESPGGAGKSERIYPAGRADFEVDEYIAWEWDTRRTVGESWYRHPRTNDIGYAWSSAGFLVGQRLMLAR